MVMCSLITAEACSLQYSQAGARGQLGPLSELLIRESQICAQGDEGTDSCSGDSGGPLMRQVRCDEQIRSHYHVWISDWNKMVLDRGCVIRDQ